VKSRFWPLQKKSEFPEGFFESRLNPGPGIREIGNPGLAWIGRIPPRCRPGGIRVGDFGVCLARRGACGLGEAASMAHLGPGTLARNLGVLPQLPPSNEPRAPFNLKALRLSGSLRLRGPPSYADVVQAGCAQWPCSRCVCKSRILVARAPDTEASGHDGTIAKSIVFSMGSPWVAGC
jgi:hypothetical protein